MLTFRLNIQPPNRKALDVKLKAAQRSGDFRMVKHILALFAVHEGHTIEQAAAILKVSKETLFQWVRHYIIYGLKGVNTRKSAGRPPKLTRSQKRELASIIDAGPSAAGFAGNCWRSPMIQHLIQEKYGVSYSVYYISELLKNLGFSYQKAAFVSDHLDETKRNQWLAKTWPEISAILGLEIEASGVCSSDAT